MAKYVDPILKQIKDILEKDGPAILRGLWRPRCHKQKPADTADGVY